MRRILTIAVIVSGGIAALAFAAYLFNNFWIQRYDDLIERHATVYNIEDRLVWSVIYEETYFRAWMKGADQEIGLMQVTPAVAREWAKETGLREFEREMESNLDEFLSDPERNIQVGCWYLEQLRAKYRGFPAERAMMLAAYNAGPSRVEEWTKDIEKSRLSEDEFLERIAIPSTRSYVGSILERYANTVESGTRNPGN
ncbi:MAG: lytic transglycosylase domain-containing protein [Acidobacteria bacterium]|nr:MAG: lytic transglycosylase domain-containing protein [Acidobacteriota bacterium]REK02397.1 MAG: lytic transglycosylase domain-containing protein [Acidobacteriota bacterium]REK13801.1 MAG: lytic transglycosylase domain-containing protein [Acidobacteriota bacterium]REK41795.1 MAG: lytic transglycosylase domain-containing protein [Acidobacteriota bacterium]